MRASPQTFAFPFPRALIGLGLAVCMAASSSRGQAPLAEPPPLLPPSIAQKPLLPTMSEPDPHEVLRAQGKDPLAKMPDLGPRIGAGGRDGDGDSPQINLIVPINQRFLLRPPGFGELAKGDISIDRPDMLGITDVKDILLQANKREVEFTAVKIGLVRITFHDSKDGMKEPKTYTIRCVADVTYLNRLVRSRFPTANLNVIAAGDNLLMIEGTADSPGDVAAAEKLLKHFFTGGVISTVRVGGVMQVQLEVVIVRVDRQVMRQMGVNALYANPYVGGGSQVGNLMSIPAFNLPNTKTVGSAASSFNPIGSAAQALTSNSTLFFGVTDAASGLFGFIEALRQHNAAQILANPTLVTYNGRTADFLVGGKQPIPTQGQNGIPVVQFEPFGTRLTFLPTIMGEGKIRLEVVPEVSTIDSSVSVTVGTVQVPRFIVQRLHATVELQSGQTLCLGGLLQTNKTAQVQKVPFLGDIPGIGALFRRVNHTTQETELLVLITPRLFDPLRAGQAPRMLPSQETVSPSDSELFLHGQLESRTPLDDPRPPNIGDRLSDSIAPGNRIPVRQPGIEAMPNARPLPPLMDNKQPDDLPPPRVRGQAPREEPQGWKELVSRPKPKWRYPWS